MAAAASNAVEERLLDALSDDQRMMLLCCCCCGQTVRDPVLLRCLHGCCSPCASQLRKEENEREATGGEAASAPGVRSAGAAPTLAPPQRSLAGQSAITLTNLGGHRELKPALPAALCRLCGEPLLLAPGGAERFNYFLASVLHSQLAKEYKGRQLVPPPPAPPPCDTCKKIGDGSAPAAASRHRCDECHLNMCDSCVYLHNVFTVHQVSASPLPRHSALTPTPACSTHGGRPCNAVCLTCTRATCDHCAWACRDRKHDVRDAIVDDRRRAIDADVVKAADARRQDVLSNRASLCDQQSLLIEHQKEASRRREAGARAAREALAARRRSLLAAVDRAHDALDECCRVPVAPSLQQPSAGRSDAAAAAVPPSYREMAALDRNVRHLLAYSKAFASLADDIILLEQHEIVTARLTMLKKDLEAATTAADRACEEGNEEERRLRELARAAPSAGEDELLEAVARLCLLGLAQQLPEALRYSSGSTFSGSSGGGDDSSSSSGDGGSAHGGSSRSSGGNSGGSRGGSNAETSGAAAADRRATMHRDSSATRSADGALAVQPGSQSQQLLRSEHHFNGEIASRTLPQTERASAAASGRPISAGAAGLTTREASSAEPSPKLPASSASRSAAAAIKTADTGRGADGAAARPPWSLFNPLQLGYPTSRFPTKTPCHGLTFTVDGNLLLAAGEEGLLEFSPGGPLAGGWQPPQPSGGYVAGAATLGDGRVAVILRDAQSLSLLRRKRRATAAEGSSGDSWIRGRGDGSRERNRARGTRWTLDRQLPLQLVPRHVAACGTLVAAVGGPTGRRLRIVSLVDDDYVLLTDRELDCAALGLALTQRLLVLLLCEPPAQQQQVASGGAVPAGSSDDRPCVVHGHAHSSGGEGDCSGGQLLWSTVCNHRASDVCASPCGQIVYLALPYADRVLALAAADGSTLTAIRTAADGWTLRKPSWLAVWQGARPAALAADNSDDSSRQSAASHGEGAAVTVSAVAAMLSTDRHSVAVFPVIP